MEEFDVKAENQRMLKLLSLFLNLGPDFIDGDMVRELAEGCRVSVTRAYAVLLAGVLGLDMADDPDDRRRFDLYLRPSVRRLDAATVREDPYVTRVPFPEVTEGPWELTHERVRAYEGFVCDDFSLSDEGLLHIPLGFFEEEVSYPAVKENGRIWMTVSPVEIRTMAPHVAAARGRVLTYGLGLGYFPFMAARKAEVASVTVVERDPRAIRLFKTHLLPHFEHPEKITVIEADAFDYAEHHMAAGGYDTVFADIWHDPSDGVEAYLRLKDTEALSPGTDFRYWIEETIRYYL